MSGGRLSALECRIPPVAQVIFIAAAMYLVSVTVPVGRLGLPKLLGVVFILVGVAIVLLGVREFTLAQTTLDPRDPDKSEHLVVRGIYRYSRNPMYAGFFVALLGWALWLGQAPGLLLLPVFVAYMNRFQIQPEERRMQEKFGREFELYRARVRRWI